MIEGIRWVEREVVTRPEQHYKSEPGVDSFEYHLPAICEIRKILQACDMDGRWYDVETVSEIR